MSGHVEGYRWGACSGHVLEQRVRWTRKLRKPKKERGQDKEDDRISTVRKVLGRLEFQIAFPPIRRGPCRGTTRSWGLFRMSDGFRSGVEAEPGEFL